jgi:hypothetical protein
MPKDITIPLTASLIGAAVGALLWQGHPDWSLWTGWVGHWLGF